MLITFKIKCTKLTRGDKRKEKKWDENIKMLAKILMNFVSEKR